MHDLGDLMVQNGFADPVMDQETIRLTYSNAETLLRDAWLLGGNPNPERRAALAGRQWRARLLQALEAGRTTQGELTLTVEVAYGHAWRSSVNRRAGETAIRLDAIGRRSGQSL
jgi:malonyl-CoA O-methyltransferase